MTKFEYDNSSLEHKIVMETISLRSEISVLKLQIKSINKINEDLIFELGMLKGEVQILKNKGR